MHGKVQSRYQVEYLRDAYQKFAIAKNGKVVMDADAVASHRGIGKSQVKGSDKGRDMQIASTCFLRCARSSFYIK